jgi:hypothetical protein
MARGVERKRIDHTQSGSHPCGTGDSDPNTSAPSGYQQPLSYAPRQVTTQIQPANPVSIALPAPTSGGFKLPSLKKIMENPIYVGSAAAGALLLLLIFQKKRA